MWIGLAGEQGKRVVLFDYAPTRAGTVPTSLLDDFSGYLVTDDYGEYCLLINLCHKYIFYLC